MLDSEILESGVRKKTLRPGEGYLKPRDGATVVVKYQGCIDNENGKKFVDQSETETTLCVDDPELPEGFVEALRSLSKGEKAQFYVAPSFGYGSSGDPKLGVPRESHLYYEIELISFENPKLSWDMTNAEKLEFGGKRKAFGDAIYRKGAAERASRIYDSVVELFQYEKELQGEEKASIDHLKFLCCSNSALCKIKDKDWKAVIDRCTRALEIKSEDVKVLIRRAKAYTERGDDVEALSDLNKALKLDPENATIKKEIAIVSKKIKKQQDRDRKMWSGAFENLADGSPKPKSKKSKSKGKKSKNDPQKSDDSSNYKMYALVGITGFLIALLFWSRRHS